MRTAYWNEPALKVAYPRSSGWETGLQIGGFLLALIAGVGILPGLPTFPGSFSVFLVLLFVPTGLSALCFWSASRVGAIFLRRAWRRAFLINNADLELDLRAVEQVIRYLKQNTRYRSVDFQNVVTHLAVSLRRDDPLNPAEHTTFSWEALNLYQHFTAGVPIEATRCPK